MDFGSSNNFNLSGAFVLFPANWTLSSQSVFQGDNKDASRFTSYSSYSNYEDMPY